MLYYDYTRLKCNRYIAKYAKTSRKPVKRMLKFLEIVWQKKVI